MRSPALVSHAQHRTALAVVYSHRRERCREGGRRPSAAAPERCRRRRGRERVRELVMELWEALPQGHAWGRRVVQVMRWIESVVRKEEDEVDDGDDFGRRVGRRRVVVQGVQ